MDIIIVCNKKDYFLATTCVASIRYFYPSHRIFLVKDELNGKFATDDLEKYFNVEILDLGLKKYGWGAAKLKILSSNLRIGSGRYLVVDADIIFVGDALARLHQLKAQFVISPEYSSENESSDWFKKTYYDINWVKQNIPDFVYPGYTFNTGQMIVTPGIIAEAELRKYILFDKYPYWTDFAKGHMPTADQSLLNILLPRMHQKGQLTVDTLDFMIWPRSERAKDITLHQVMDRKCPYVLHYAGLRRVPALQYMSHSAILFFFKRAYFKKLPMGLLRFHFDNVYQTMTYNFVEFLKRVKRILTL